MYFTVALYVMKMHGYILVSDSVCRLLKGTYCAYLSHFSMLAFKLHTWLKFQIIRLQTAPYARCQVVVFYAQQHEMS